MRYDTPWRRCSFVSSLTRGRSDGSNDALMAFQGGEDKTVSWRHPISPVHNDVLGMKRRLFALRIVASSLFFPLFLGAITIIWTVRVSRSTIHEKGPPPPRPSRDPLFQRRLSFANHSRLSILDRNRGVLVVLGVIVQTFLINSSCSSSSRSTWYLRSTLALLHRKEAPDGSHARRDPYRDNHSKNMLRPAPSRVPSLPTQSSQPLQEIDFQATLVIVYRIDPVFPQSPSSPSISDLSGSSPHPSRPPTFDLHLAKTFPPFHNQPCLPRRPPSRPRALLSTTLSRPSHLLLLPPI